MHLELPIFLWLVPVAELRIFYVVKQPHKKMVCNKITAMNTPN
jgi:hypothetical protein